MKLKELPGWDSALQSARMHYQLVPAKAFELAGEKEAAPGQTFISSGNEVYVEACRTGLVRLRNGQRAHVDPRG